MSQSILQGCKLLIVENDELNAQLIMFQLEHEGMEFIGPAASVARASALLESHKPDLVMLDYRLNGETVEPVIALLESRGTPYVLVTGAMPEQFRQKFPRTPVLLKPFLSQDLIDILRKTLAASAR